MDEESFLTERQLDVLRRRKAGQTLDRIAKSLDTTRQNISAIEKSAEKNIAQAKKTVEIARLLDAPLWLSFDADTDIDDAISEIYKKSNEKRLHLPYDGIAMAELIKKSASNKIKGRRILFTLEVGVTDQGELIVV